MYIPLAEMLRGRWIANLLVFVFLFCSPLVIAFSPLAVAGSVGGIYGKVWALMTSYERDPYNGVALLAKTVLQNIRTKAKEAMKISGGSK
jgi:hypothetical protein